MTTPTSLDPSPSAARASEGIAGRVLLPAVVGALLALLAAGPVLYSFYRHLPPRVATVDLEALITEQQQAIAGTAPRDTELSQAARNDAALRSVAFAKTLSHAVDTLGQQCGCVLVNKAALLGGVTIDYTEDVRALMHAEAH